jgi:hypothetical protein
MVQCLRVPARDGPLRSGRPARDGKPTSKQVEAAAEAVSPKRQPIPGPVMFDEDDWRRQA